MPNGGITPDCVHCKWYHGQPYDNGDLFCELHKMRLAYPIYAFCSAHADRVQQGTPWLDQELDRKALKDGMMYVWLGGYEVKFFYVPLAPFEEYKNWSSDRFLEELSRLSDENRPK